MQPAGCLISNPRATAQELSLWGAYQRVKKALLSANYSADHSRLQWRTPLAAAYTGTARNLISNHDIITSRLHSTSQLPACKAPAQIGVTRHPRKHELPSRRIK